MSAKETFSVAGAARELGVGLAYMYSLVYSGKIEAAKVDGRWTIPAAAVKAALEKRSARL